MHMRISALISSTAALLVGLAVPAAPVASVMFVPLAIEAPDTGAIPSDTSPACTTPAPVHTYSMYHCYTPQQISDAYGVSGVHDATAYNRDQNYGQGQTIVLVDSYGSPTAAADLQYFHKVFFPSFPAPRFDEVYPLGTIDYNNTKSSGLSGPAAAASWTGEATLDIEWSYAIAPLAHIVLLAVPPAETEGVQGLPNMFKAIRLAIDTYPKGTIFSQSFGLTEQTFEGAARVQTSSFDQTYKNGNVKGDTFLASSGDNGSVGVSKQHKDGTIYSYPTVGWPASSPYVTAVGGTQLQDGWTWAPTSSDFTNNAAGYFASTIGGNSEAVWNESWLPAASGGGPSAIYARPSWQSSEAGIIGGNARGVPDVAWNAAVNGGVLVYISAYPTYQRTGWHVYGGTSASSPQMAGVIALANEARNAAGKGPLGQLNPTLYSIGNSDTAAFNDIVPQTYGVMTLSDNQLAGFSVPGWKTQAGWDMTTGFGTPHVAQFVADLTAS